MTEHLELGSRARDGRVVTKTPEEIAALLARGLSAEQRASLVNALVDDVHGRRIRRGDLISGLISLGLVRGASAARRIPGGLHTLTHLGLAVRAHLQSNGDEGGR